jgi:hypothetical protein
MRGLGLPEVFMLVPMALLGLLYNGVIVYAIWKFYHLLSKMNDNIDGIRQALERNGRSGPGGPV